MITCRHWNDPGRDTRHGVPGPEHADRLAGPHPVQMRAPPGRAPPAGKRVRDRALRVPVIQAHHKEVTGGGPSR